MGTRDDEYDYLFKGTAGGAQMREGMAAMRQTGGPKLCPGPWVEAGVRG